MPAIQAVDQGYINHIAFVLDASSSMEPISSEVVKVADQQVKALAAQSQHHDQETRATVYLFGSEVTCAWYDKDVLRLPSLAGRYRANGMTRLVDATMQAIEDLEKTATLYGDHSFMLFILTDGEENHSSSANLARIHSKLQSLPNNWTVAILVPNQRGVSEAKKWGFLSSNIEKWDATAQGIIEVGQKLERATDAYMTMRSKGTGFRGTTSIFTLDAQSVQKAVQQGALKTLDKDAYRLFPVRSKQPISSFMQSVTGRPYEIGSTFYQLTKREEVQPQKEIAIRSRTTGQVFIGDVARQMLGLGNDYEKISPTDNTDFDIFIQSTSVNRALVPNSDVLYIPYSRK